ncbi:MAG: response regulator [Deltaproteobacteria bacterium]|nr:response regulator [Deltaproteobacteria bacterium]
MVRSDRAGKQLVLVVDDNYLVRRALVRELSKSFIVITASNSSEAREILAACEDIRVIVSDCRMDSLSAGAELFKETSVRYPEIGRILVSGTLDRIQTKELMKRGIVHAFFQKPWNREELIKVIANYCKDTEPSSVIKG